MPNGDRTGPFGEGPRTGRAAGFCAGYDRPGSMNPQRGFGFGRRFRGGAGPGFGGRGWRNQFRGGAGPGWGRGGRFAYDDYYPAPVPVAQPREDELDMLKSEANVLKENLEAIDKRITELEGKKDES